MTAVVIHRLAVNACPLRIARITPLLDMPVTTLLLAALYLSLVYCLLLVAKHRFKWPTTPPRDAGMGNG